MCYFKFSFTFIIKFLFTGKIGYLILPQKSIGILIANDTKQCSFKYDVSQCFVRSKSLLLLINLKGDNF